MICVLTPCGGQESGKADPNPKVLGCCFGIFSSQKKRQVLLLAIRKTNTWIGELLLKIGKNHHNAVYRYVEEKIAF